jgi:hypothetical protein
MVSEVRLEDETCCLEIVNCIKAGYYWIFYIIGEKHTSNLLAKKRFCLVKGFLDGMLQMNRSI